MKGQKSKSASPEDNLLEMAIQDELKSQVTKAEKETSELRKQLKESKDMESNYVGRDDYSIKQQDADIINKRLGPIPTSLERQDNILTLIGPGLVAILVLISSVSAIVSISAACASVAVAEMSTSITSNSFLK